jgi:hypothetical protein
VTVAVLWLAPLDAAAQMAPAAGRRDALNVFLDCASICDDEFIRREIAIVDYVRDRSDADVHVLITRRTTGGGGAEYTLAFIGAGPFTGIDQTLQYVAIESSTEDETRTAIADAFKRGLVRYLSETTLADRVAVEFLPAQGSEPPGARDRWNLWVFAVNGSGAVNGESSTSGISVSGSVSANRTTDRVKTTLSANATYRGDTFQLGAADRFRSESKSFETSALVVRSLTDRWSTGVVGDVQSSTFLNYDLRTRVASGIEYNVFPYSESTRRMLTIQYTVGGNQMDYVEETIFGKMSERLLDHRLATSFSMRQPWGSGFAEVAVSQFFNDSRKFNVSALGNASLRVARGLSLTVSASATRAQDQISLPGVGATVEEILVRERQLATSYRYALMFGMTYSFGSIFNHVVNPRFGGAGGSLAF